MLIVTLSVAFLLLLALLRVLAHVGRDGMVHADLPGERRDPWLAALRGERPARVKPKRLG